MASVRIDIVADVACPWCYLGKARLELAIGEIQDRVSIEIAWHPFLIETVNTTNDGDNPVANARIEELERLGNEVGIAFDFARASSKIDSFNAHRLIHWAGTEGAETQDRVVSALFRAHFEEGRDIADPAELSTIAGNSGMSAKVVSALLASEADNDTVKEDLDAAKTMGISEVPIFIIDGQYAISGAQTPDVIANALLEIATAKEKALSQLN